MKKIIIIFILLAITVGLFALTQNSNNGSCFTGAFIADRPSVEDIMEFEKEYGKKPHYVMVFVDWGNFIEDDVFDSIDSAGSVPIITWEPWYAHAKEGINYDGLIQGEYNKYLEEFIKDITGYKNDIYLRFAHEMNGNWYPWAVSRIGAEKYKDMYRYIRDFFDKKGVKNVQWIFSINWQDVPQAKENNFVDYYPGNQYVDFLGIDGYNWGDTKEWSKWMSFKDIFSSSYFMITSRIKKPVIIAEFGCAESGGNKTKWIKDALNNIKSWDKIEGFVLFNIDKETNWKFKANSGESNALRHGLADKYFK